MESFPLKEDRGNLIEPRGALHFHQPLWGPSQMGVLKFSNFCGGQRTKFVKVCLLIPS